MNVFEFIFGIVLIGAIVSVIQARSGVSHGRRRRRGREHEIEQSERDEGENARLRDEVRQLNERLAVLERITVEKENSLAREIDNLRDAPSVGRRRDEARP